MNVIPGTIRRIAAHRVQQRSYLGAVVTLVLFSRYGSGNFIGECQKIAVNLNQTLGETLAKTDRWRSQELEDCASLANLHASNGALVRHRELIAIPQADGNAGITDPPHDPLDQCAIKTRLRNAIACLNMHTSRLSEVAYLLFWYPFAWQTIPDYRIASQKSAYAVDTEPDIRT